MRRRARWTTARPSPHHASRCGRSANGALDRLAPSDDRLGCFDDHGVLAGHEFPKVVRRSSHPRALARRPHRGLRRSAQGLASVVARPSSQLTARLEALPQGSRRARRTHEFANNLADCSDSRLTPCGELGMGSNATSLPKPRQSPAKSVDVDKVETDCNLLICRTFPSAGQISPIIRVGEVPGSNPGAPISESPGVARRPAACPRRPPAATRAISRDARPPARTPARRRARAPPRARAG
jgi:hypothetical protein